MEGEAGQQREKEGSARTFIGPAVRGGGPPRNSVMSPESGALIGPARPGRDGRKPQHSITSKMTLSRKNILLRPHDMI